MRQPPYLLILIILLCAAVAIPVLAFLAYRSRRGSRRALISNCLLAAGYELALAIPLALTLGNLRLLPSDIGIRDFASGMGGWAFPLALLLVILGHALSLVTKKETAR